MKKKWALSLFSSMGIGAPQSHGRSEMFSLRPDGHRDYGEVGFGLCH